ncbi:MAG: tyrosine-protein phosphatase [Armatimonadota bacterium]
MIDIHCHILPEMGDGPNTLREALLMACQAVEEQISVVVATPHFYSLNGDDTLFGTLLERIEDFQRSLDAEGIPLTVLPGAEVFPGPAIFTALDNELPLFIGNTSRYLLLEMPLTVPPTGLDQLVYTLQLKGITPIIAHPERILAVQYNIRAIEALVGRGVLIQLNAGSLLGEFGDKAKAAAFTLLQRRWVHFLASDAHDSKRRRFHLAKALEIAARHIGVVDAQNLVQTNPLCVIHGEEIVSSRPLYPLPR